GDYLSGLKKGVRGMRIGVPREHFWDRIESGVEAVVRQALRDLEGAGAQVKEVSIPHMAAALGAILVTEMASVTAWHDKYLKQPERRAKYTPEVRALMDAGKFIFATDFLKAQRLRRALTDEVRAASAGSRRARGLTPRRSADVRLEARPSERLRPGRHPRQRPRHVPQGELRPPDRLGTQGEYRRRRHDARLRGGRLRPRQRQDGASGTTRDRAAARGGPTDRDLRVLHEDGPLPEPHRGRALVRLLPRHLRSTRRPRRPRVRRDPARDRAAARRARDREGQAERVLRDAASQHADLPQRRHPDRHRD